MKKLYPTMMSECSQINQVNETNFFVLLSSLEEYEMNPVDDKMKKSEEMKKIIAKNPSPIHPLRQKPPDVERKQIVTKNLTPKRPARQNVVLIEDLLYHPGRKGRPHK